MEVNIDVTSKNTTFDMIEIGDAFQQGSKFYIKVDLDKGFDVLEDWLENFGKDVIVTPRKATLSIL